MRIFNTILGLSMTMMVLGCLKRNGGVAVSAVKSDRDAGSPACPSAQWEADGSLEDGEAEQVFIRPMRCTTGKGFGLGAIDNRPSFYWQNGRVAYRFDSALSSRLKRKFLEATEIWGKGVNQQLALADSKMQLQSVEDKDKSAKDFVLVVGGQESSASVTGKIGGEQELKFRDRATQRAVLHEVGHVLGLSHEQSRCDRDEYIDVLYNNVDDDKKVNFKRRCITTQAFFKYNIASIMHYSSDAFSKNGRPTMVLLTDKKKTWEQPDEPHELDFATVARGMMEYGSKSIQSDLQQ